LNYDQAILEYILDQCHVQANVEAGLKQAYGEDPAIYWVSSKFSFSTTRSEAFDDEYLNDLLSRIRIKTWYYEFSGQSCGLKKVYSRILISILISPFEVFVFSFRRFHPYAILILLASIC
jgi:hypothetical protein